MPRLLIIITFKRLPDFSDISNTEPKRLALISFYYFGELAHSIVKRSSSYIRGSFLSETQTITTAKAVVS